MDLDLDDDLPSAPAAEAVVETLDVAGDVYGTVPKMGEAVPAGTYHVRLHSYQKAQYEDGPVYSLQWRIQEEPHTGRVFFSNCAWPTKEDILTANDPELPPGVKQAAQKRVVDRLVVAKAIQEAAGIAPGSMPFEDFLATNPEMRIQISITDKKERVKDDLGNDVLDQKGQPKWKSTGEKKNKVQKYISLVRPQ